MIPFLISLLSLVLFVSPVAAAGFIERWRRRTAETDLGFWDANVLAALDGSAIT